MKQLKLLFVEDIKERLSYSINEICIEEHGYYKIKSTNPEIKKKDNDYFISNAKKYCYLITSENYILEKIYPDKVRTLRPIVENLYEFEKKDIENIPNDKGKQKVKRLK